MAAAGQPAPYQVKCGRCGVVFATRDCGKLEHFGIYRVVCPHCHWPGRYLASELHAQSPKRRPAKPAAARPVKSTG